ncbi:MAG: nuclear transport factor 2 family protein [Candidatus Limnocylindrales bacterium]
MVDRAAAHAWVERYVRAWTSNEPAEIGALFTSEAVYRPTPMAQGWHGRDVIVAGWLERKDTPGNWQFEFEVLAVDGDLGVIRGRTTYVKPSITYENLWLVRFDRVGRATEFIEYWIQHPKPPQPRKPRTAA